MKRRTIWAISTIMALTFIGLIFIQIRYFDEIVDTRHEQFDESVGHVLYAAARSVELEDTRATIEQEIEANDTIHRRQAKDEFCAIRDRLESVSSADSANYSVHTLQHEQETREMRREHMRQRFLYQKDLLGKAVYDILYKPLDRPVGERTNVETVDRFIQQELHRHGIYRRYHFKLTTLDGEEIFRCGDYEAPGDAKVYKHTIYPKDPPMYQAVMCVHFPHAARHNFTTVSLLVPSLTLMFILLVTFTYTIWIIFRQKKLTEMKNDFVNNMTHEFKTPLSTISLAAEMLSDPVVSKNETSLRRFAGIIADETKRLRFQVDKVLQTSLFEKGRAAQFKKDELDANAIIEEVASTFNIKVHNVGGTIETQLDAEDPIINADQMHFTNVIYNLLDNAVKYRRQDSIDGTPPPPLHLNIQTKNEGNRLVIRINDNGIGIRREDLKRIFNRFFRVHTGNRHDVKGFGLGLAYVSSVVEAHKGRIHAESTYGEGTTFVITLPLMED